MTWLFYPLCFSSYLMFGVGTALTLEYMMKQSRPWSDMDRGVVCLLWPLTLVGTVVIALVESMSGLARCAGLLVTWIGKKG